jgi:hypothetical protein
VADKLSLTNGRFVVEDKFSSMTKETAFLSGVNYLRASKVVSYKLLSYLGDFISNPYDSY